MINHKDFLSNIDKNHKDLILQAAQDTGFNIVVEDNATDKFGRALSYLVAIYTYDTAKAHDVFWQRFRALRDGE